MSEVVIAGASGFVGRELIKNLRDSDHHIIALSRSERDSESDQVEWRQCNVFNLQETSDALAGADYAVYLVHNMMKRGRWTQGDFQDHDLIAADNFGRAAAGAGVKQIVYLGGLMPDTEELSPHLRSRVEVEQALGQHGVPVTALRAGLVVGPGGSSTDILTRLVKRLPAMLCPRWTSTETQPIALRDVVALLRFSIGNPDTYADVFDVGGPDVLTYQEMMRQTGQALGVRRPMAPVPLLTPRLSAAWVSLIAGVPMALARPLVESLKCRMVARDRRLQNMANVPGITFEEAIRSSLESSSPAKVPKRKSRPPVRKAPNMRAVHRLTTRHEADARAIADHYMGWLGRAMQLLLWTDITGKTNTFGLRLTRWKLFELTPDTDRSSPDQAFLTVTGGWLSRGTGGHLEFRITADHHGRRRVVLAVVDNFSPRLPYWIYRWTQAPLHQWIMRRFARELERSDEPLQHAADELTAEDEEQAQKLAG